MRVRLVGYEGARPPIPVTTPVLPEDPGPGGSVDTGVHPDPLVVQFNNGDVFDKFEYLALGFNHFDVMCIGGCGGRGGGLPLGTTVHNDVAYRKFHHTYPAGHPSDVRTLIETGPAITYNEHFFRKGQAGGGGGVHRIKGRLVLLPSAMPIVVGSGGLNSAVAAADGADGGYSAFGDLCKASGGKGGRQFGAAVGPNSGRGGIGNSITPGGGAAAGEVGTWDGLIGQGGGAGIGLVGAAAIGKAGAYSSSDTTVSGPGGAVESQPITQESTNLRYDWQDLGTYPPTTSPFYATEVQNNDIVAIEQTIEAANGFGGGAKTFPLNGNLTPFGSGAGGAWRDGIVLVRMTYVIV